MCPCVDVCTPTVPAHARADLYACVRLLTCLWEDVCFRTYACKRADVVRVLC